MDTNAHFSDEELLTEVKQLLQFTQLISGRTRTPNHILLQIFLNHSSIPSCYLSTGSLAQSQSGCIRAPVCQQQNPL